jgi:hypothetical protein
MMMRHDPCVFSRSGDRPQAAGFLKAAAPQRMPGSFLLQHHPDLTALEPIGSAYMLPPSAIVQSPLPAASMA